MHIQKLILSIIALLMLSVFSAEAQIIESKPVKTWESNGFSTAPVSRNPQNIDLGQNQRLETIAKMEIEEKNLNSLAISGDGRVSKSENAVLNNIKSLKESIK